MTQALAERRRLRKEATPVKGARVRFAVEEGEGPGEAAQAQELPAVARSPQSSSRQSPPSGRSPGAAPSGRAGHQRSRSQEQLLRQAESIRRQLQVRKLVHLLLALSTTDDLPILMRSTLGQPTVDVKGHA